MFVYVLYVTYTTCLYTCNMQRIQIRRLPQQDLLLFEWNHHHQSNHGPESMDGRDE